MPNTNDLMVDMALQAQSETDGQPHSGQRQHLAQHHPDDTPPFGAQRHSDADFVGAARHRIGHGAIEPDTGDHSARIAKAVQRSAKVRSWAMVLSIRCDLRHHTCDREYSARLHGQLCEPSRPAPVGRPPCAVRRT